MSKETEVTKEKFDKFIEDYPRKLDRDVARMCFPEMIMYYDFTLAEGWDAVVCKKQPIYEGEGYGVATGKFKYWIGENLTK